MPNPRLIATSDIHGCQTAMELLLAEIDLQPGDVLIGLGDYVDRGPNSRAVLERMIALFDAGQLIPIRGNHELMMMQARDSLQAEKFWRNFGGDEAIESYAPDDVQGRLKHVPDRHWRFMASDCKDWHETDEFIFVHAGVNPLLPLAEQTEDDLLWRPLTDRGPHQSGKLVVCGHTVQHSGVPLNLGHTICIDTGSFCDGWLTALDVNSREYWQANELGQLRRGQLA